MNDYRHLARCLRDAGYGSHTRAAVEPADDAALALIRPYFLSSLRQTRLSAKPSQLCRPLQRPGRNAESASRYLSLSPDCICSGPRTALASSGQNSDAAQATGAKQPRRSDLRLGNCSPCPPSPSHQASSELPANPKLSENALTDPPVPHLHRSRHDGVDLVVRLFVPPPRPPVPSMLELVGAAPE